MIKKFLCWLIGHKWEVFQVNSEVHKDMCFLRECSRCSSSQIGVRK